MEHIFGFTSIIISTHVHTANYGLFLVSQRLRLKSVHCKCQPKKDKNQVNTKYERNENVYIYVLS